MSLDKYSQTPASNDLPGYGNTGMPPSLVKNAFWDVMADLCQVVGSGSLPTSGGTANAQTITNTRQVAAWFPGMWVCWIPNATNTAAMTIAPDGLAATNVFANGVAALAGMVVLGVPAIGRYDGTQVNLINPQRSTASFTGTLTGASGASGTVNYAMEPDGKSFKAWAPSSIAGTSTITAMTMTGVPAALVSTTSKFETINLENNSVAILGVVQTGTSTTWTFGTPGLSGFTSSNLKGLFAGSGFSSSTD